MLQEQCPLRVQKDGEMTDWHKCTWRVIGECHLSKPKMGECCWSWYRVKFARTPYYFEAHSSCVVATTQWVYWSSLMPHASCTLLWKGNGYWALRDEISMSNDVSCCVFQYPLVQFYIGWCCQYLLILGSPHLVSSGVARWHKHSKSWTSHFWRHIEGMIIQSEDSEPNGVPFFVATLTGGRECTICGDLAAWLARPIRPSLTGSIRSSLSRSEHHKHSVKS